MNRIKYLQVTSCVFSSYAFSSYAALPSLFYSRVLPWQHDHYDVDYKCQVRVHSPLRANGIINLPLISPSRALSLEQKEGKQYINTSLWRWMWTLSYILYKVHIYVNILIRAGTICLSPDSMPSRYLVADLISIAISTLCCDLIFRFIVIFVNFLNTRSWEKVESCISWGIFPKTMQTIQISQPVFPTFISASSLLYCEGLRECENNKHTV